MQTLTILKFSSLLATLVYLEKTPPPPCPILDLSFKPCANGRNIVGCYMLRPFAHPAACCWMLLRKVGNRSNFSAKNSQHFFCSVIAEAQCNNVASICTALPTLLGPCTLIMHGLQRLIGCILPTMHCMSQHCWELLHPFAHHCQHAHNNSQHCWCNNVGSCCIRLHAALDTEL